MPEFEVVRDDLYVFSVEAKDASSALLKVTTADHDQYLNGGSFAGSEFKLVDDDEFLCECDDCCEARGFLQGHHQLLLDGDL